MQNPQLTFLGATGTVTGSRYLVDGTESRILVDCGMFQGLKALRQRNWSPLPAPIASIDAVVLTHAHVDHSGYLPKLYQQGYRGPVYCTLGTCDLLQLLLPDCAFLQEEEARYANKLGYSKHSPAKPLFTREDAEGALRLLQPAAFHQAFSPAPGFSAKFTRAGHIVGSACVGLSFDKTTLTFSGDVGRPVDPIMRAPEPLSPTDALVIESTYGDRRHPTESVHDELARVVNATSARGGVVVVPAFAVGRAQHLLHILATLKAEKRIPDLPIHLDSPMAIEATDLFCKHTDDHRLTAAECKLLCRSARYARTADESKAIDASSGPMIIVSASGMATGGRVLHHLRRFLPDERNHVLFVGHQAVGTRGRSLVDGAEELKMHGQYVRVRARISQIQGLSAHADYAELIAWLKASGIAPRHVFVTHGEPAAADALRRRLQEELGWKAETPEMAEVVHLP
jgi:metallo-beta-lactamase family protein